jgi:serine/threonine-protein kinase
MPLTATSSLLDALRAHPLLRPGQLEELLRDDPNRFAEARALAQHLLERGWLTPFQVNQLLLGRGAELLLGPYLLIERLGEGFGGTVFKARHQRMNRDVALRVVRKELLADPEAIRQFYAQVQTAGKLDHDNVVHAYDAGPIGETHFLATEYVDGINTAWMVKQYGALPVAQACEYIRQAACGLAHAHEHRLVHHGLKPSKLMVTKAHGDSSAGLIKILDLGLTRLHRAGQPAGATEAPGTAHYPAPEQQSAGSSADIRADIYSLGCIFSYLLTARPPDGADPSVPGPVLAILKRMSAPAPADRYATPAELAQDLQALGAGAGTTGSEVNLTQGPNRGSTLNILLPEPPARRRSASAEGMRWAMFVALGGALLVGGFFVFQALLFSGSAASRQSTVTEAPPPVPGGWLDPAQISAEEQKIAGPQPDLVGVLRMGTAPVRAVGFHPKNTYLAAGSDDGMIRLCDWNTGLLLTPWEAHPKGVRSLAFSPDGLSLASAGKDKKVKLWEVSSRREKHAWNAQADPITFLAFTPDSQQLAGRFLLKELRIIDLASGKDRHFLKGGTKVITSMAISPEGKTMVVGLQEKSLIFFDLPGSKRTGAVDGHATAVRALAFSSDGKTLASAGDDKLVKLWDPATNKQRAALTGHKAAVAALAFAPDSQTLASAAADGHVILWRAAEKVTISEWHLPAGTEDLAISPDGRFLAAASTNGAVYVLRLPVTTEDKR